MLPGLVVPEIKRMKVHCLFFEGSHVGAWVLVSGSPLTADM